MKKSLKVFKLLISLFFVSIGGCFASDLVPGFPDHLAGSSLEQEAYRNYIRAQSEEEARGSSEKEAKLKAEAENARTKANEAARDAQLAKEKTSEIREKAKELGLDPNDDEAILNSNLAMEFRNAVSEEKNAHETYKTLDQIALEEDRKYAEYHRKLVQEKERVENVTEQLLNLRKRLTELTNASLEFRDNKQSMTELEIQEAEKLLNLKLDLLIRDFCEIENKHSSALTPQEQAQRHVMGLNDGTRTALEAINKNLHPDSPPKVIGDPVYLSTGSFYYSDEDTFFKYGINTFSVTRTYVSGLEIYGMFGAGWISSLDACLVHGEGNLTMQAYIELQKLQDGTEKLTSDLTDLELLKNKGAELRFEIEKEKKIVDEVKNDVLKSLYGQQNSVRHNSYVPENICSKLKKLPTDTITFVNGYGGLNIFLYDAKKNIYFSIGDASYIELDNQNFKLHMSNGVVETFNQYGKPICVTDRFGSSITFVYEDSSMKLSKITHNDSLILEFEYVDGMLIKIHNTITNKYTYYGYTDNELTSVSNEDGFAVSFAYNETGLLSSIQKPSEAISHIMYGKKQSETEFHVISTVNEESGTEYFYKTASGVMYVDPDGTFTEYEVVDGRITKELYSDGSFVRREFDKKGRILITENMFHRVSYEYDANGNCSKAIYDDGSEECWVYNESNYILKYIDRDGIVTRYVYDEDFFCTDIYVGNINTTHFERTSWGGIASVTQSGEKRCFCYDDNYNVSQTDSAVYAYNNQNLVEYVTARSGEKYVYSYNEKDNCAELELPNGDKKIIKKDERGNVTKIVTIDSISGISYLEGFKYNKQNLLVEYCQGMSNTKVDEGFTTVAKVSIYYTPAGNIEKYIRWNEGVAIENDAPGVCESYQYSGNNMLVSKEVFFVDFQGNKICEGTKYEYVSKYDAGQKIVDVYVDRGYAGTFYLNDRGQILRTVDPEGRSNVFQFSPAGRLLRKIDERGAVVQYMYNHENGLIDSVSDSSGVIYEYEWDKYGRLSTVKEADGVVTNYNYKSEEYRKTITVSDFKTTSHVTTDLSGNILSSLITDKDGNVIQCDNFSYDTKNRNVTLARGDREFLFKYNVLGMITDNSDLDVVRAFNIDGKLIYLKEGTGSKNAVETFYSYNSYNQISNISDSLGNVINYYYDHNGRLLRCVDENGLVWCGNYDKFGNLITEKGRLITERSYEYDKSGNLTRVKENGAEILSMSYSFDLSKTEIQYASGKRVTQFFDNLGRIVSESINEDKSGSWTYDVRTGCVEYLDRANNKFIYRRDRSGNVISICSNTDDTQFTLDELGYITSARAGSVELRFCYDLNHNLTTESFGADTVHYSYNSLGLKTDIYWENERVHFDYDNLGRLSCISSNEGWRRFHYEKSLQWTSSCDSSGNQYHRKFDNSGRLIEQTQIYNDEIVFSQAQLYDDYGRIKLQLTRTLENIYMKRYRYDDMGRLCSFDMTYSPEYERCVLDLVESYGLSSSVNYGVSEVKLEDDEENFLFDFCRINRTVGEEILRVWSEAFEYDGSGNRTLWRTPVCILEFTYDIENRLINITSSEGLDEVVFLYDSNGNVIKVLSPNRIENFGYNTRGQLEEVCVSNLMEKTESKVNYMYDAFGRVIKESWMDGTSVYSFYDGFSFRKIKELHVNERTQSAQSPSYRYRNVLDYEDRKSQGVTKWFIWENDVPSIEISPNKFISFFCDKNNSVLTASSGIDDYTHVCYSVNGFPCIEGCLRPSFLFCAKEFSDETNLCNFGFRFYNTFVARFMEEDPVRDGINWYTYANDDPVNLTDKQGLVVTPPDILHTMSVYGMRGNENVEGEYIVKSDGTKEVRRFGELLGDTSTGELVYMEGCYETYYSGASNTLRGTCYTPLDINRTPGVFINGSGNIDNAKMCELLGLEYDVWTRKNRGNLNEYIDAYNETSTEYVLSAQVRYTKNNDGEHFVGIDGGTVIINGRTYIKITATSDQDLWKTDNLGVSRPLDWLKQSGATYVPIESVLEIRVHSKKKSK